jgi:hypothetical protein
MKILKEGTITITPEGKIEATGFTVEGRNCGQELRLLVASRVRAAYEDLRLLVPETNR